MVGSGERTVDGAAAGGEQRTVVVTGVSTGIGLALAQRLLAGGYRVFGSVRKEADAARLQASLGAAFAPLIFDVTDAEAIGRAAEEVGTALGGRTLGGLVNNAGIAQPGQLLQLPLDALRHQLEVNLTSVLGVTQAFAPLLGAAPAATRPKGSPGRIVNIGSISGYVAFPFLGAYSASKFGLEALSDVLRRELMPYGVDVILIRPGSFRSEIWGKEPEYTDELLQSDYAHALSRFRKGAEKNARRLPPPDRVTRAVQRSLELPRPRARYNVAPQWLSTWLMPHLLPDRLLDRVIARATHLNRRW
jgi:NAD(P)-dependent dehydrogenase (short-subunit alcohol dehydrogenase family)